MGILGCHDTLPLRPRRITVAGTSGSGKSTLAQLIGELAGVPYTEHDSLFHGPGWTVRETYTQEVVEFVSGEAWVIEWQGGLTRAAIAANADLMVWLDLPRWLTTWRVTRRTISRRLNRTVLWAGNTEGPLLRTLFSPASIIRYSWRTHPRRRRQVLDLVAAGQHPHLHVVRLRSQREVDAWLAGPFGTAVASPEV